jgi:DNA-binding HxlR family transcriptional regulator
MEQQCPAETLLKQLAGKWKPQVFRMASNSPVRFNELCRTLAGASRQAIAVALKEMEADGLLVRTIICEKPLHTEYQLSSKGHTLLPLFFQLELLSSNRETESQP